MTLVSLAWGAATAYLFLHPGEGTFITWGTISGTMIAAYQWLCVYDDKKLDAGVAPNVSPA
jgi:hypothetical protein